MSRRHVAVTAWPECAGQQAHVEWLQMSDSRAQRDVCRDSAPITFSLTQLPGVGTCETQQSYMNHTSLDALLHGPVGKQSRVPACAMCGEAAGDTKFNLVSPGSSTCQLYGYTCSVRKSKYGLYSILLKSSPTAPRGQSRCDQTGWASTHTVLEPSELYTLQLPCTMQF
jgi:hypothetical protein